MAEVVASHSQNAALVISLRFPFNQRLPAGRERMALLCRDEFEHIIEED